MQSRLSHRSVCGGRRAQIAICVIIRSYERRISALQNSLETALQTANLQQSEAQQARPDDAQQEVTYEDTDDESTQHDDGDSDEEASPDSDAQ